MNVLLYGCDLISQRTKSGFIWFAVSKSTAPFPYLRGVFPYLIYLSGPQYLTLTVVSAFSYLYSDCIGNSAAAASHAPCKITSRCMQNPGNATAYKYLKRSRPVCKILYNHQPNSVAFVQQFSIVWGRSRATNHSKAP